MTIPDLFDRSIAAFPREAALSHWSPAGERRLSSDDLRLEVARVAAGLQTLDMRHGDRMVLLSENRPEWAVLDYATQFSGGVLVPVYPSLTAPQLRFILENAEARFAAASTRSLLDRLREAADGIESLDRMLVFDPRDDGGAESPGIVPLPDVAALGDERLREAPDCWRDRLPSLTGHDVATIIYTSGTTGNPKGVVLTHENITSNVETLCSVLDFQPTDVALSFLPLCHVTQRIADYCYFHRGVRIVHVPLEDFASALGAVRPTTFPGVPRVFEKVRESILNRVARAPATKRALFGWALSVGRRAAERGIAGAPTGAWLRLRMRLADRLVLSKVREGLGGRIRYLVCGGAPLNPEVTRFFLAMGLPILEGYGLTETAVLTINRRDAIRPGTVGPPLPGVDLRIDPDGEILASGPNVSSGYHANPEATAEAFEEGWFRTGDIGRIDEDGSLRITGRKKELLVTSGGKKIAPAPIEQSVLSHGIVSQVVLVGDRRKYIAALVVPNRDQLLERCLALGIRANGQAPEPGGPSYPEILDLPAVRALYREIFDTVNRDLARFEQIKKFALLPTEFSLEGGELTPTLKIRRRVVEEKYRDVIASLYETPRERKETTVTEESRNR